MNECMYILFPSCKHNIKAYSMQHFFKNQSELKFSESLRSVAKCNDICQVRVVTIWSYMKNIKYFLLGVIFLCAFEVSF